MIDSLYIGASGMHAQQMNVDVIANNLANVNTTSFKKSRVDFEDLMYRNVARANGPIGSADNAHRLGVGTAIASAEKVFSDGDLKKTERPLDLAIRGPGFLEVLMPDGNAAYTRSGALQIGGDGMLSTIDGRRLADSIHVPSDATGILIYPNGQVMAQIPRSSQLMEIGQIRLAQFTNPAGLQPMGDNLYVPTEKSGDAQSGTPGEGGRGQLAQGFLETSNVKLVEEMVNLILGQRAYEINSKVVQASDEMLSIINGLYR